MGKSYYIFEFKLNISGMKNILIHIQIVIKTYIFSFLIEDE